MSLTHLKRLTWPQRHAFTACFLGWSLDAFDFFLLVVCIPAISAEFHAKVAEVSEAVFLTLAFRPVGALLFGWLADRYGRRRILMLNILCFSCLEMACAFAPSLASLLILRALFGIAMGGEWGVGAALAFETLPKEGRGFFSGILQEGYAIGNLIASAAFWIFFDRIGWRGLFLLGSLPILLVPYLWFLVEESPVWTAKLASSKIQSARLEGNSVGFFRGLHRYAPRFLFLVLLMTAFTAFSHGTQDLYPTFLLKDHHFSAAITGKMGVVYNIGAICGGVFFGNLSERIGRKRAIITATLLTLFAIPLFAFSASAVWLAVGSFLMQFFVQGAWGVVPAYLSELSPGPVRATFPGFAYQLGNLLTSKNSVLQAHFAEQYGGFAPVLGMTVVLGAFFLATVTSFGKESRGEELA